MESTFSYCSHCGSVNNVSNEKALSKKAVCGKCGATLPMHSLVTEVDEKGLLKLQQKSKIPLIIDFWAPWCGPCKMFTPTFEEASKRLAGKALLVKVNTENHPQVGGRFGVRGIPSLVVLKNGREVGRQAGAMPLDTFINWTGQFL